MHSEGTRKGQRSDHFSSMFEDKALDLAGVDCCARSLWSRQRKQDNMDVARPEEAGLLPST